MHIYNTTINIYLIIFNTEFKYVICYLRIHIHMYICLCRHYSDVLFDKGT